ncbi:hypothetical protein [Paracoccus spongiarum]|uniref:Dynamin n=1 Tax=Paracoccus spongiarum TaxID=3064387 RepID=A0ABT9JF57_9RHOB|nr:hypothetical protein [Paracoccus sp. 2205BS29-5]MDP5307696.1 hypothetical protein [Paracoccus sp. 2205BS29-5]
MSHNEHRPETAARNHRPAIIAIAVALLVAVIAYFVFLPGIDEQNEGIATTPPPAESTLSDAEGTGAEGSAPISPEGAAPVGETDETAAPAN